MEYPDLIKKALATAQEALGRGEAGRAAAAFEKAATFTGFYADQALGRDAEIRRKKKSLEYRQMAQRLRSGEWVPAPTTPAPAGGDPGGDGEDRGEPAGLEKAPGANAEIRAAVSALIHASPLTWKDIGGLEDTKSEIKFALGLSLARRPAGVDLKGWTNILFYGPPGTGKTLLAAATSNAVQNSQGARAVFFNVKVSSVLSKYFGESSKIVSELYGMARDTSPTVVFLDEFESLGSHRDSMDSGPERRLLSTLLSELDGMESKGRSDLYVLTIAATNRPWDLDPAVLSRFEKKILIPLPDRTAREAILRIHLERKGFKTAVPLSQLAETTDGFSGREIERFCKEVTNRMIIGCNRELGLLVDEGLDRVRSYSVQVRELTDADFRQARSKISPQTTAEENRKYQQWKESNAD